MHIIVKMIRYSMPWNFKVYPRIMIPGYYGLYCCHPTIYRIIYRHIFNLINWMIMHTIYHIPNPFGEPKLMHLKSGIMILSLCCPGLLGSTGLYL